MAVRATSRLRSTSGVQLRTLAYALQDMRKAFACGFAATSSSIGKGCYCEPKLEELDLVLKDRIARVLKDRVQLERSEDSQFEAFTKGQSVRRPCHNGLTTGDASGLRSEASLNARRSLASPYGWIQVAYRAEYLTSNCGHSVSALKLHSAAFSTHRDKQETTRRDLAAQDEDPFDPLTDRIPAKPVTFAEGASYTVAIFLGFAVAAAAAYAVFKELIFEPKEYKVFNKALDRVQNDNQVTVRIGLPVTGYGQDSRNRAARQRIPHRTWADEDGVERIEVQFFVRGPHGVGRVHSEMFKDKEDKQWKFTYLIVDILSPSPTRIMLESYVPT